MEEMDFKALGNPKNFILNNGGSIFVALLNNRSIGICAFIKSNTTIYDYELAKKEVLPKQHGKGIRYKLSITYIEKAKEYRCHYFIFRNQYHFKIRNKTSH